MCIFLEYLKKQKDQDEKIDTVSDLWSTDGKVLSPNDDLCSAAGSNHSGVLKIVYEK